MYINSNEHEKGISTPKLRKENDFIFAIYYYMYLTVKVVYKIYFS